jgi:chromate reductase
VAVNNEEITIAGFGGSFRKGSYNGMLLREAQRLMPPSSRLEISDISGIPLYNQDNENQENVNITNFRNSIKNSGGFLVVTPEYNFSIPGYLKNAIDSVSRPSNMNPFAGKPGAIMSASMSMLGGSRAQYHLRQVFTFLDARMINRPEVFISFANTKFDEKGHLKDEMAVKFIRELLEKLVESARTYTGLKP